MRVNGTAVTIDDPTARLLDVLRDDLGLRGAKDGCSAGRCGACTVLVDGAPVCACLVLVGQVATADIVTAEGLQFADPLAQPDLTERLRTSLVDEHATQCGYCIPGFTVAAHALLADDPAPDDARMYRALEGNLCRCTGYRSITRALRQVHP